MAPLLKQSIGILAIVLTVLGYTPYVRDVLAGKTRPHAFTWLVTGLLTGISFFAQAANGAGLGAWVTGLGAIGSVGIFLLAFWYGERRIVAADWVCLAGAAAALALWVITDDPLLSLVLIICTDLFGFAPTVRKSWLRPHEETVSVYLLTALRFSLAIAAMGSYSIVTWLYPAYIAAVTCSLSVLLIVRRRQIAAA